MDDDPYLIKPTSRARRDISRLPEAVALSCLEFTAGPLAENPHRVGKALEPAPLPGCTLREGGALSLIHI